MAETNFKKIYHGDNSSDRLMEGVTQLTDAVKSTLGPRGQNVIIEMNHGAHITKDGVTVAKSIEFADNSINLGAKIIKEAAQETADSAGDGTTTATVLAHTIFKKGLETVKKTAASPIHLQRGMKLASKDLVNKLEDLAVSADDPESLQQVATISANGDETIGSMIGEAIRQVSKDGVVTVEEGNSTENKLEIEEGLTYEHGYLSHYFMNNNRKLSCELEDVYVLLYDGIIRNPEDISNLLEQCAIQKKKLAVIAHNVEGQAMQLMVVNAARQVIQVLATKAPGFGSDRHEMLKDIAALTGGKLFSPESDELEDATFDELGKCRRIESTKSKTTLIAGKGSEEELKARIEEIKKQRDDETESDYNREKYQKRLAKLSNGVAVISVGAESEVEVKEIKDRVDDAILATKAALDEGIVAGGGSALIHAAYAAMDTSWSDLEGMHEDVEAGYNIVLEACKQPFIEICRNAGFEDHVIKANIDQIEKAKHPTGFNVMTGQIAHMIEEKIIDPVKVTRIALEKAVSVASTLLTTSCMITKDKDVDEEMD